MLDLATWSFAVQTSGLDSLGVARVSSARLGQILAEPIDEAIAIVREQLLDNLFCKSIIQLLWW